MFEVSVLCLDLIKRRLPGTQTRALRIVAYEAFLRAGTGRLLDVGAGERRAGGRCGRGLLAREMGECCVLTV